MALSKPAGPCSELEAIGVYLSDPIEKFWSVIGDSMSEANRIYCQEIAAHLKDEFMMVTVGSMRNNALTRSDMETAIEDHGGKKGWLRTIEHYLAFSYGHKQGNIPDSAVLAQTGAAPGFQGIKVGAYLKARKELGLLRPPHHVMWDAVVETADPTRTRLSYNDSKTLMTAIFQWVVTRFKSVRKCKYMFDTLSAYLHEEFPGTPKAVFAKKLFDRWKNGCAKKAKVCFHSC
jgi:hypothetical protein